MRFYARIGEGKSVYNAGQGLLHLLVFQGTHIQGEHIRHNYNSCSKNNVRHI